MVHNRNKHDQRFDLKIIFAQSARAVEYTDSFSPMRFLDMTLNSQMVRSQ